MKLDISDLEAKVKELQKEMEERGKTAFQDQSKEIFEKYPDLASFSWTQYTPYFNDGDECTFNVYDYLNVKFSDGQDLEDWSSGSRKYHKNVEAKYADAADAAHKLVTTIPEGIMKKIFGDHVAVKVARGKIEVEEFDHE